MTDGCGSALECGACGGVLVCKSNSCVSPTACSSDEECTTEQFCYSGDCQSVLGRQYRFTIVDATVGTTMPDGSSWDFGGGAPDLFVAFGFDPNNLYVTEVVQDQFSASWNSYADLTMPSGGTFYISLYDADATANDYAAGWTGPGNDALVALARTHGAVQTLQDQSGTITVHIKVEPLF